MVSAWATRLGVCFGQVKTNEKSNEITAIPELLELLSLKGMIVTIDAMGCQKKIAQKSMQIIDITKAFFACHELGEEVCKKLENE